MKLPEGDINTMANVITLSGGAGVAMGVHQGVDTPLGLLLIAVGRGQDLRDGRRAREDGNDSELGAILDATTDKIGCAAIVYSMWRKGIVPTVAFTGMALQNTANGYASAKAQKNHPETPLLPSKKGKLAMFSQNIAVLSYGLSHVLEIEADKVVSVEASEQEKITKYRKATKISRVVGHVAAGVGVLGLGIPATRGYFKRI